MPVETSAAAALCTQLLLSLAPILKEEENRVEILYLELQSLNNASDKEEKNRERMTKVLFIFVHTKQEIYDNPENYSANSHNLKDIFCLQVDFLVQYSTCRGFWLIVCSYKKCM